VAADIPGVDVSMHKYTMQITVADVRDGAPPAILEGSKQLGKVELTYEQQMVTLKLLSPFPSSLVTLSTNKLMPLARVRQ